MKRKGILLLTGLLSLCLLSGCITRRLDNALPVISTQKPIQVNLFSKDYIGKDKVEVEALLGGFVQEEYYNGGLIYKFSGSDMWFWFGTNSDTYNDVPNDAACCFVMAPLSDAAAFTEDSVSKDALSNALGFSFDEPVFNEMDEIYNYYAVENGISCTVSCSDDGTVSIENDYIIYALENE